MLVAVPKLDSWKKNCMLAGGGRISLGASESAIKGAMIRHVCCVEA
jgi:hypothetical protein